MDDLRSKMSAGVIALAAEADGKALLVLSVSKDLHGRFTAPDLMKKISVEIGGGGGGRPDLAQAGGSKPEGIKAALSRLEALLAE
jgi:alanyl-tRNA synthetase